MDSSGFKLLVMVLFVLFLLFSETYKRIKAEKKNKQLETDYNELIKQVELLVHENNILKKHGTDMT